MKRTIIASLLAVFCLAGQAKVKSIVWESPLKAYTTNELFEVRKVELTKEKTILYARYNCLPGYWFTISKDSYLQTGGKRYEIIGSDTILLSTKSYIDNSGKKDFILYFKPLPMKTKEFDFLEGLSDGDFKVFGIHDSTYVFPPAPVPAEYLADYPEEEELQELKYSDEPAIVHIKALNYRKGMEPQIRAHYKDLRNPSEPADTTFRINDEGEAELSLHICFPQVVWFNLSNIPWGSNCFLYLVPGMEITVLADMLHDDVYTNDKFVGYKGSFAKLSKEYCKLLIGLQTNETPMKETARTVEELIRDYDECCAGDVKYIESQPCSKSLKDLFIQETYDCYYFNGLLDSLSKTQEFIEHVIRQYNIGLRSKTAVFNDNFVRASRYYVMDKNARGINADLARYCYYLPKVLDGQKVEKPLIEDPQLSALYDNVVADYQKTIAANKQDLADNIHYLDMTDVAPEDIQQTILDKYKGKTVFIDIWATWCGPCRYGHKKMAPLKEELKDKNIQFVYITSPSSPYKDWKGMIGEISGDHYYLTKAQYDALLSLYKSNGTPTYAIYDANGNQTYTIVGFPGAETFKEEINKALNK
jgi:thiol-disulfide isomerase/thioredoxin